MACYLWSMHHSFIMISSLCFCTIAPAVSLKLEQNHDEVPYNKSRTNLKTYRHWTDKVYIPAKAAINAKHLNMFYLLVINHLTKHHIDVLFWFM
jgi:hypothetical protein